jgi:hypothetical protein
MYAWDAATGDGCQVTYYQAKGGGAAQGGASSGAIQIHVNSVPPSGTQDIQGKVSHPQKTNGFVFLILWRKHKGSLQRSVILNRLCDQNQTPFAFKQIQLDQWDLVSVNVVAKGYEKNQTVKPNIIKAPK